MGFIAMKPLAGGAIENGSLALRYVCSNQAVTVVIREWQKYLNWKRTLRHALTQHLLQRQSLQKWNRSAISWAPISAVAAITVRHVRLESASQAHSFSQDIWNATIWLTGRKTATAAWQ